MKTINTKKYRNNFFELLQIVLIAMPRNWPGSVTMLTLTEPLTTDAIGMIPLW